MIEIGRLKLMTATELDAEWRERLALPPTDARHPYGFRKDAANACWVIYWGGGDYEVPFVEITTPEQFAGWLHHILQKGWPLATPERVSWWIDRVYAHNGWQLYRAQPKAESRKDERAKLTPQLRSKVLARDNYSCVQCGASPNTGAWLHVDHIVPIAKGGRTELWNLQTLCSTCNYGKGAE